MNKENKPVKTLVFATILALLGTILLYDCFFKHAPLGANVPLLFVLFYAALLLLFGGQCNLLRHQNYLLLLLGFGFSTTFMLYNNGFLLFLNALALLFIVPLQINLMLGLEAASPYTVSSAKDICFTVFVRPFHRIGKAFSPEKNERKAFFPILMAALILIPVLGILLYLLSSADQVFSQLLGRVFRMDSVMDIISFLLLFAAGALLLGSLFTSLFSVRQQQVPGKEKKPAKFNLVAVSVVLAGVAFLMVIFCLVQGIFLFGSAKLPGGLTYSEYARQGFFQLCAAAIFVFALVALCRTCTRQAEGGWKTALGALYTLLLLCTMVLICSSFYRLMLYEQVYSFTRLRIYVQAFLILLALICGYSIANVWLPSWKGFAQTVLVTAFTCLLGLSFFNADAFIAKQNVARMDKTMEADGEYGDLDYLLNLSIDALPYYLGEIEKSDLLPEPEPSYYSSEYWNRNALRERRCHRLAMLIYQIEASSDLRYWNANRAALDGRLEVVKGYLLEANDSYSRYFGQ